MKTAFATLVFLWLVALAASTLATSSAGLEDYEAFALALQDAVDHYDMEFLNEHTDMDGLLAETTKDFPDPEGDAGKFAKGFKESLSKAGIGTMIERALAEGPTYEFLRVRELDGKPHMLFRLYGDQGLNYHEYLLGMNGEDQVEIKDMYIYASGEYVSATFRNLYNQGISAWDGWVDILSGKRKRMQNSILELNEGKELMQQGYFAAAHEKFKKLSEGDILPKGAALLRIQCASMLDEDLYREAMEDFGEKYSDDPSWLLMAMDYEILQGNFNAALRAVAKLDKYIGGDPVLDVFRADLHVEKGDLERARVLAREIREQNPDLEDVYWTLVVVALYEEDYRTVADELDLIKQRFLYEFDPLDLAGEELYAGFVASEIGQAWCAEQ